MSSTAVVKSIDELEQGICNLLTRLPFVAPDELRFDGFEESLDNSVTLDLLPRVQRRIGHLIHKLNFPELFLASLIQTWRKGFAVNSHVPTMWGQ